MSRILRCHPPIPGTAPRAANCLTVGVHPTCHMRIRLRAAVTTAVDQGWRCWLATRQRHAARNWIGVPCPAQHCIICNVA